MERESIEMDVLFVGAGPASLSGALHLSRLVSEHNEAVEKGTRKGKSLPVTRNAKDYVPGDLVTWRLPSGVPHIGIVSDRKTAAGVPLVIHNIGQGTQEEDSLFAFTLTGHYRYAPEDLRPCRR